MQKIPVGAKVRVVNPHHWLFDKTGHVVKMTLDGHIKKQMAGAAPMKSAGIPVDFERPLRGWYDTPLRTEDKDQRSKTHDCDGALKRKTGYYVLERDLEILDIPDGIEL